MDAIPRGHKGKMYTAQWVSLPNAATYLNVSLQLIHTWITRGVIQAIQHPIHKGMKAIPYSEIQRILGVGNEIIVPYNGRIYPHQVFLFYLAVTYGRRFGVWRQHLKDLKFPVPPDDELRAIADATMGTAPAPVRRLMKRLKDFTKAKGYEEWVDRLGFTEPQEDLFEFVPMNIVANTHIRWLVEICGSSGMKPIEVCNSVRQVADIAIGPLMVKNYLWMFHYIRQLSTSDWGLYIEGEYKRNSWRATVREECVDNPLGVYKHLKIKHGIDAGEQLEDLVWSLKHQFDRHIDSNGENGRAHALNAARVLNGTIANLLKLKQIMGEESDALHKKRQQIEGVGEGGTNPTNIAELTMKDEAPTFEELMAQGKQAVEEEKTG